MAEGHFCIIPNGTKSYGLRIDTGGYVLQSFEPGVRALTKRNPNYRKHERFNQLLKAARSELDELMRRQMYGEMQRLIREEGGVVIPVFVNHVMAATTKIKFNKISGLKDLDEYRVAERWWFE